LWYGGLPGSPVIVSDIATDALWEAPEHRESALKHGLRASWSNPVLSWKGKVLGTFCMYYREPRTPNSEDLKLIELGTQVVRIAIERDRAQQALRQSEAYLAEAQRLTHTGSWAWSLMEGCNVQAISRRIGTPLLLVLVVAIGLGYGALKADNPWSGDGLDANLLLMATSALVLLVYAAPAVGAAAIVAKAAANLRL
jgi:hypothetical protein